MLILTFGVASGYNLNNKTIKSLPIGEPGLVGWSLVHQQESLYVGAPQARETGRVFHCQNLLTTDPTCEVLKIADNTPGLNGSWFGGSLAASEDKLYSCAFRYNWENFDYGSRENAKLRTGKCYKKGTTGFEDLFDFTKLYEKRVRENKLRIPRDNSFEMYVDGDVNFQWLDNGVYGVSSTVDKKGNLVIGNPLDLDKIGNERTPDRIFVGSIGKIENIRRGRTLMIRPMSKETPWFPIKQEDIKSGKKRREDWSLNRFAGYVVTSGKFFTGDTGLAIGAPKIDNYRGKVWICKRCFQPSPKFFPSFNGKKPGEHFGSSLAVCDIDGDGREDLLVGAPNYARTKETYNTGRVDVIMVTGDKGNDIDKFDKPYNITAKQEKKNAMFGSSIACLGNTDGRENRKVMVGAPYYEEKGAVFVFRSKLETATGKYKLELSQIIMSQGLEFLNSKNKT